MDVLARLHKVTFHKHTIKLEQKKVFCMFCDNESKQQMFKYTRTYIQQLSHYYYFLFLIL